jgi:Uma2 family endonuclease
MLICERREKLRAVAFQEDDGWVAHLLEFDIMVQAESIDALPQELEKLSALQQHAYSEYSLDPLGRFKPAPLRYWLMYQNGSPLAGPSEVRIRLYEGARTIEALGERSLSPSSPLGPFRQKDYVLLENEVPCELLNGRFYPSPSRTVSELEMIVLLWVYLYGKTDWEGDVLTAPVDMVLADHTSVQPDIFYINPKLKAALPEEGDRIEAIPDLVVEVLSPASMRLDRGPKQRAYARFGVREYWLVDLAGRKIDFLVNHNGRFKAALPSAGIYRSKFAREGLNINKLWDEFDA